MQLRLLFVWWGNAESIFYQLLPCWDAYVSCSCLVQESYLNRIGMYQQSSSFHKYSSPVPSPSATPCPLHSDWARGSWVSFPCVWYHRDRWSCCCAWAEGVAFWPKGFDGFQCLHGSGGTCWSWRAVEPDLLIEVMVLLSGLAVPLGALVCPLVLADHVEVPIFTRAAVYLADVWQGHFFHFSFFILSPSYHR